MPFFADDTEVDQYIGGVFRAGAEHPESGPKLAAAGLFLKVYYSDPDCEMNVHMNEPRLTTSVGPTEQKPDIVLVMKSDTGDKFWRGEYNLAVGLAKGEVRAKGPVNKILKLVPLTKPLFPIYRDLVAEKDAKVGR